MEVNQIVNEETVKVNSVPAVKKTPAQIVGILVTIFSVAMVLYHLIYALSLFLNIYMHQNVHLMLALIIIILSEIKKELESERSKAKKIARCVYLMVVMAAGVIGCVYVFTQGLDLVYRAGVNTDMDIVMGTMIIIACLIACRLSVGWVLVILAIVFIAYTLLGHLLPNPFWHFQVNFSAAVSKFCIGFSGVYGDSMQVSANYIFLFMVFGEFLAIAGGTTFFLELSKIIGKRVPSGAGITTLVSCGLMGMVTGSGMANASICGPFTTPLMRSSGYTDKETSGVLTTAATGALIVPPVMGVVAFVMAEYTGISYGHICLISIAPCVLYYFCLGVYVVFAGRKNGIRRMGDDVKVDVKGLISTCYMFLIPLGLIIVLLTMAMSLRMISFWICISVVALSLFQKRTRKPLKVWVKAMESGAAAGANIAMASAAIGLVLGAFEVTNLGNRLPSLMIEWANGNLIIALVLVAVVTIILGCGVPPFASYMMVSMMCASILEELGCTVLQAHYFIFLFTVFGQMTPPVAVTAVAAAPICNVSYLTAGVQAVRVGWLAWIMPFFIIWCPALILESADYLQAALTLVAIVVMTIILQVANLGYFRIKATVLERLIALTAGFLLIVYCFQPSVLLYAVALGLAALFYVIHRLRERKLSAGTAVG